MITCLRVHCNFYMTSCSGTDDFYLAAVWSSPARLTITSCWCWIAYAAATILTVPRLYQAPVYHILSKQQQILPQSNVKGPQPGGYTLTIAASRDAALRHLRWQIDVIISKSTWQLFPPYPGWQIHSTPPLRPTTHVPLLEHWCWSQTDTWHHFPASIIFHLYVHIARLSNVTNG